MIQVLFFIGGPSFDHGEFYILGRFETVEAGLDWMSSSESIFNVWISARGVFGLRSSLLVNNTRDDLLFDNWNFYRHMNDRSILNFWLLALAEPKRKQDHTNN